MNAGRPRFPGEHRVAVPTRRLIRTLARSAALTKSRARSDAKPASTFAERALNSEQLLERARGRGDRLRVARSSALFLGVERAVAGAAVDLELEREFCAAQLLHHLVDDGKREALVLGRAGSGTCPWPSAPIRRGGRGTRPDRDIGDERRAGRAQLDADRAAEAVADERDLGRVDHRVLESVSNPRLRRARISGRSLE